MATNNAINASLPISVANGGTGRTTNPSFLAYQNSTGSNVTGDATQYVLNYDTVVWDTTSSFDTGNFRYVIPTTGNYLFTLGCRLNDVTTAVTGIAYFLRIDGAGTNYLVTQCTNSLFAGGYQMLNGSYPIRLTAGQTVGAMVQANGTTKTLDVQGFSTYYYAYISGFLVST